MERREGGEEGGWREKCCDQSIPHRDRKAEGEFHLAPVELCAVRRANSRRSSILHVQMWVSPKSQWCIDLLYKS